MLPDQALKGNMQASNPCMSITEHLGVVQASKTRILEPVTFRTAWRLLSAMNVHQKRVRAKKIGLKTLKLRNQLWPKLDEKGLWMRDTHQGYTTIPRPMPVILRIMDDLSNGKPVSVTYFALWCRVWDECFVTITNPREMAFEVGFTGQRAEATWASRMKILAELGFVDIKPGASGDYNYVLIWNPFKIIKKLHVEGKVQKRKYVALLDRAQNVGADDLD